MARASAPSLDGQLEHALSARALAPGVSAGLVVDLSTGATLFAHEADTSLEPASNEKLCVTYTALVELGASYRFRTAVLGEGHRVGSVWDGNLVLTGYGDPSLTSGGLAHLAGILRREGIRQVTGHIVGDDSWFDAERGVAGWRPSFYGTESPPLSALVVDRGQWRNRLVADPPLAAAAQLYRILQDYGIVTRGAVARPAHASAVTLATAYSQPLGALLVQMDRDSDNFTAELVLKEIGAEVRGIGSSASGTVVVSRDLAAAGVPLAGVRVVDGSGLSRSDRVTARELGALLTLIWNTPSMRGIVWRSLATAGVNGTLHRRLQYRPTRGLVHAKTGTTDVASALSGYVGTRYAFVVLQNGYPVNWVAAHLAQDRFVRALAVRAAAG